MAMMNLFPDNHEIFAHVSSTISAEEIMSKLSKAESVMMNRMTEEEKEDFLREKQIEHERDVSRRKKRNKH